jgi:hypothetical protein
MRFAAGDGNLVSLWLMVALVIVPAAIVDAATYTRVVPVAASNEGLYGTHWSTDLSIFSRAEDQWITVQISFMADADGDEAPTQVPVQIAPLSVVDINDVVADLFGGQGTGAIRLESDHPFEATSRTFNDGGGTGVHGEGIPAVDPATYLTPEDPIGPAPYWMLLGAGNRPGADGERTNIGMVNLFPSQTEVRIELFDPESGEWLGPVTVELGPCGWLQQNLFDMFGVEEWEVDNTMVAVAGLRYDVYAYLSRVDNLSGDGTFIMPVSGWAERTLPRVWEITLTLDYTEGVEAHLFIYDDGGPGESTLVGDPESGWSVTETFESPSTLCYAVYAEADDRGGEVGVERVLVVQGPGGGEGRKGTGRGTAGPLSIEDCIEMD